MASPWSQDVLYSPDPPFLFGGGSGNETTSRCEHTAYLIRCVCRVPNSTEDRIN